VVSLRKKVVSAQLALKYATDPERLKRLKEKIRLKIKAERTALDTANHKKITYERKAKAKRAELIATKAKAAKRAARKKTAPAERGG